MVIVGETISTVLDTFSAAEVDADGAVVFTVSGLIFGSVASVFTYGSSDMFC